MKVSEENLDELLTRRVEKILPSREGLKKLVLDKKIRLYNGIDPTGKKLHLGHTIGLRKLMEFADLGHDVILVFGTGTVLVGDPSQRDSGRKLITESEIEDNIKTWKKQVSPIVDFNKVKIMYNSDWLTKLSLKDIIKIASNISAVQLFKRDMFQKRLEKGDAVWYHETMYPLFQGYDSVVMDVDLEIGGSDQEFNMLIGRELQRKINNREKYVLTWPMILGIDGQKMSKTSGNCVWLDDIPNDMFGKIMSIPDNQIISYMELVTNLPLVRVREVEKLLKEEKIGPLAAKKELASAVVSELHSQKDAQDASLFFEKTFQEKKPEYSKTIPAKENLADTIAQVTGSVSEAKRLIKEGAVDVSGKKASDPTVNLTGGEEIKIGKKIFVKIK
jgi:tyrosyl-tRNA synthetase